MEKLLAVNKSYLIVSPIVSSVIGMSSAGFAETPPPPYYAVIFTSRRTKGDNGYSETSDKIVTLVAQQPGFLGVESVRGADGLGITVSYWASEEDGLRWRRNAEHQLAQQLGKKTWYQDYSLRVAEVKRSYIK